MGDDGDDGGGGAVGGRGTSGRRRWTHVLGWLASIGFLVLAVLALRGRFEEARALGGLPAVAPVAAAAGLNLVANAVLVVAWREIVTLVGPTLRLGRAAWIWSVSQLARFSFSGAHVGARVVLARREGVGALAGTGTTLVEIIWASALNPLLILATVPWWLPGADRWTWVAWIGLLPGVIVVVAAVAPDRLVALARWITGWSLVQRVAVGQRLHVAAQRLHIGRRAGLELTGLFLGNAALRLTAFLLVAAATQIDVGSQLGRLIGAYALGQFAGRLAFFAPGGLGPREGVTAAVLAPAIGGTPALILVAAERVAELVGELGFLGVARLASVGATPGDATSGGTTSGDATPGEQDTDRDEATTGGSR